MLTSRAFVAVLVVSSDPRHQLLRRSAAFLSSRLLEVFRLVASQSRCQAPTMEDLDFTALTDSVGKPKMVCFGRFLHFEALRDGKMVFCEV